MNYLAYGISTWLTKELYTKYNNEKMEEEEIEIDIRDMEYVKKYEEIYRKVKESEKRRERGKGKENGLQKMITEKLEEKLVKWEEETREKIYKIMEKETSGEIIIYIGPKIKEGIKVMIRGIEKIYESIYYIYPKYFDEKMYYRLIKKKQDTAIYNLCRFKTKYYLKLLTIDEKILKIVNKIADYDQIDEINNKMNYHKERYEKWHERLVEIEKITKLKERIDNHMYCLDLCILSEKDINEQLKAYDQKHIYQKRKDKLILSYENYLNYNRNDHFFQYYLDLYSNKFISYISRYLNILELKDYQTYYKKYVNYINNDSLLVNNYNFFQLNNIFSISTNLS